MTSTGGATVLSTGARSDGSEKLPSFHTTKGEATMADDDATRKPRAKFEPVTLSDEDRDRLEDEHGDVLVLRGSERAPWLMVLRRPTRPETLAYKSQARRENANGSPGTANEALMKRITVYPEQARMDVQFARWPLLADGIADATAFREFVGIAVDADLK